MIKSATGLKAKVRNISKGDSKSVQDEFDYPGVRVHMEALFEKLKQPIKIDISTDDAITPGAIEYKYPLMFEEREICLNTYNIETLLAEKLQTIINRGLANTEMKKMWNQFKLKNYFVEDIEYSKIIKVISDMTMKLYG